MTASCARTGVRANLAAVAATDEAWNVLRALRANPPGRAAGDGPRREVFSAALEQAEQFLRAASAIGYATKPVQLFYALSQSGRAIAAVRADEPWEIRGHGASVIPSLVVGETTVEPDQSRFGAIGIVARATASDIWDGPAQLGALWASLPELPAEPALCGSAPGALEVLLDRTDFGTAVRVSDGMTLTSPVVRGGLSIRAGLLPHQIPAGHDDEKGAIAEVLAPYPYAAGWSLGSGWIPNQGLIPTWIQWRHEEDGQRVVTAVEALTEDYEGRTFFRPAIGGASAVPSPLIAWWGVLLALSSLARYAPVGWRQALDIDNSPIGWALERGLSTAERRIPELVLKAMTSPPIR